jgi:hypothetical protein
LKASVDESSGALLLDAAARLFDLPTPVGTSAAPVAEARAANDDATDTRH